MANGQDCEGIIFLMLLRTYIIADDENKVSAMAFQHLLNTCTTTGNRFCANLANNTGIQTWRNKWRNLPSHHSFVTQDMRWGDASDAKPLISQFVIDIREEAWTRFLEQTGQLKSGSAKDLVGHQIVIPHIEPKFAHNNPNLTFQDIRNVFDELRDVGIPVERDWDRLEF